MTPREHPSPRWIRWLLLLIFFFSGFSTLIYEIVWVKYLVYLFGVTYHAVTTVVTVFMVGLAGGALAAGRYVDRTDKPLRLYAYLELFIGLCGLLFPAILAAVSAVYAQLHSLVEVGFFAHILVRFFLSCLILLPPTVAMGATLPALTRFFVGRQADIGRDTGRLYGINTLGAALGCGLTGFVLMTTLGLSATTWVAVALNVLAAGAALWLGRATASGGEAASTPGEGPSSSPAPSEAPPDAARPGERGWLLGVFFLSGFTAIAYEILWVRIVANLHPNAHTLVFALVLGIFLIGTGLGSVLYAQLRPSPRGALALYVALQLVAGLAAVASPFVWMEAKARLGFDWYALWPTAQAVFDLYLSRPELGLICVVVGIPSICLGMVFPLGNSLYVKRLTVLGAGVGAVYFACTVGGIAGSFVTGFFLMPALGTKGSLFVMGAINLALAGVLLLSAFRVPVVARVAVGVVVGAVGIAGMLRLAERMPDWAFLNIPVKARVDFYRDGRSTTDGVLQVFDGPYMRPLLFANGEFVGPTAIGIWIPIVLHPDPEEVMILAFDTGANSSISVMDPHVESVEAVDISDVQDDIAPYFSEFNHDVLNHPKFRFVSNDGRNHLLTARREYEVIFNGVALYSAYLELSTREYFELCKSRLAPGGIYGHKLHLASLTEPAFKRVLATFAEVFPHAALFSSRYHDIYIMVGFNGEPSYDYPTFVEALAERGIQENYHVAPDELAKYFLMGGEGFKAVAGDAPILVDNFPPRLRDTFTNVDTGAIGIVDTMPGAPQRAMEVRERHIHSLMDTMSKHMQHPSVLFDAFPRDYYRRHHRKVR